MKKYLVPLVLLAVVLIIGMYAMNFYNGTVGLNEDVGKQWSNVENAYQLHAVPKLPVMETERK